LLSSLTNSDHDAFQILHHIIISEPEYTISAGCKPFIAPVVVAKTLFEIVTFAIDLNDWFAGVRDEVSDVISHRALPSESKQGEPMGFQMTPQKRFGTRRSPP
jgi:hypothetical protein